jgi:hypothetical protein
MGMLNKEELVTAVLNNIKTWNWDINTKFSMTEEESKAVMEVLDLWKAQQMANRLREAQQIMRGLDK